MSDSTFQSALHDAIVDLDRLSEEEKCTESGSEPDDEILKAARLAKQKEERGAFLLRCFLSFRLCDALFGTPRFR